MFLPSPTQPTSKKCRAGQEPLQLGGPDGRDHVAAHAAAQGRQARQDRVQLPEDEGLRGPARRPRRASRVAPRDPRPPPRSYTSQRPPTKFVVDDNGHLVDKGRKTGSSFQAKPKQGDGRFTVRWPQENGETKMPKSPRATMGHKGIITNYLPSDTITLPTVCMVSNTR